MKKLFLIAVPALVMLAGCQTPGRITGAEINSLEPAQMKALAESDAYVYQSDAAIAARAEPVVSEKVGVPWLEAVKAAISAKWRVTFIKIEWGRPAAAVAK